MLKSYFTTAFRFIFKNKLQSFINIFGLSIGISAFLMIFNYVNSELGYDQFHPNYERTYRLTTTSTINGDVDRMALNGLPAGPMLQADYPQVEAFCRLIHLPKQTIWYEDKVFSESTACFADSTLFKVFGYELLEGDANALKKPNAIVITENKAIKYFGSAAEAMGKPLKFPTRTDYVSAVIRDKREDTHIPFEFFTSVSTLSQQFVDDHNKDFLWMTGSTYLTLKAGVTAESFTSALETFYTNTLDPWAKANDLGGTLRYNLQPLSSIHLDNSFKFEPMLVSNPAYIYIFSLVGIFIITIAAINYMNLATARSSKRSLEVGIRKVVGAKRNQLSFQFLSESLVVVFISTLVAYGLIYLLLPMFNEITGKEFFMHDFVQTQFLFRTFLITIILGLLAGVYPATYLSSFNPIQVLKLKVAAVGKSNGLYSLLNPINLRRGLVITQFVLSAGLIAATLIVFNQLDFIRNKDLGFQKDLVYVIDIPSDTTIANHLDAIKTSLTQNPHILSVGSSSSVPGFNFGKLTFNVNQEDGPAEIKLLNFMVADHDLLKVLNLEVVAGRNFSNEILSDQTEAFIVNEAAVKELKWKEPLDMKLGSGFGNDGRIIGVIKDFNFLSLHNSIEPLVMMYSKNTAGFLLIKVRPEDLNETMSFVESTWKGFDPAHPYEGFFLDDNLANSYLKEARMHKLFTYFSVLTIFISCLGLFGLATFTTELKIREIGIRKVLGASVSQLIQVVARDFLIMVIVANVIAWPLVYYYMNDWLNSFAYRVPFSPSPFVISAVLSVIISLLTVGLIAYKAAVNNAVKALKSE